MKNRYLIQESRMTGIKRCISLMLLGGFSMKGLAQDIAVKSNVLYDATTTLNIGGEIRCNDTHTFQLSLTYNPWEFGAEKKTKFLLGQLEYRKWLQGEAFWGLFVGAQAHGGMYNWEGMLPWGIGGNHAFSSSRYQGTLAGVGVSCGYQWLVSTSWNVEVALSVGYAYLDYDRYDKRKAGAPLSKGHYNYIGPTQLGVSFVYFIK